MINSEPLENTKVEKCQPLFRWAGGKRRLLGQILPLLPKKYDRYFEPFCGGAAMFFALQPKNAVLCDKNEELINCYRQIKESPDAVIEAVSKLKGNKALYYEIRASRPKSDIKRAARLIYLMCYSFNGIFRVNSSGGFNVPYGGAKKRLLDISRIKDVHNALTNVELVSGDFEDAVSKATAGDLIYFDPPYTVAHGNNGFVQYNEKILSWQDQERLALVARKLVNKGCHVIVSNADHSSLEELYFDFTKRRVSRHSGIGALPKSRKIITEFVFSN